MATPYNRHTYSERELLERLGYTGPFGPYAHLVVKSYDWTGAVTNQAVWTPASGNRWIACCIVINTSGACTVTLFDGANDTEHRIFKGSLAANANVLSPHIYFPCSSIKIARSASPSCATPKSALTSGTFFINSVRS